MPWIDACATTDIDAEDVLRLDHGESEILAVAQQVVGPPATAPPRLAPHEENPPVREGPLLLDGMGCVVPAGSLEPGNDEEAASVSFGVQGLEPLASRPLRGSAPESPEHRSRSTAAREGMCVMLAPSADPAAFCSVDSRWPMPPSAAANGGMRHSPPRSARWPKRVSDAAPPWQATRHRGPPRTCRACTPLGCRTACR